MIQTLNEIIKPYNIENIKEGIVSIDKLIELDSKKHGLIIELKRSLIRIERASKKEFWIDNELKKEIEKTRLEVIKENPNGKSSVFNSVMKAKKNIMNKEKFLMNLKDKNALWETGIFPSWNDFKFYMKKQYENDRQKFIKEGLILNENS